MTDMSKVPKNAHQTKDSAAFNPTMNRCCTVPPPPPPPPGLPKFTRLLLGVLLKLVALGRPNKSDDPDGHGTHVAGLVLGDGNSPTMGGAIQGTAPKARLIVQFLVGAESGGIPATCTIYSRHHTLMTTHGFRLNSWGATTPGLPYSQSSREIDDFIWNHQDCTICFAAGNDGTDGNHDGAIDPASLGSEAAAKNCITVGATETPVTTST